MKKMMIFAVVIFCCAYNLNAQDIEPSSLTFTYYANSSTYTEPFDLDKFQQTEFMLGWQWYRFLRITNDQLRIEENFIIL